jgi:signal transduction histidine kinase
LLSGALLALAVGVALFVAATAMGAPRGDVEQLAVLLSLSGAASLLAGAVLVRAGGMRLGSLRLRLALAYSAGIFVAGANVVATSVLMFINHHDLLLLLLLLGYAAVISLVFGHSVARALTGELERLGRAANRLATGDLSVRVGPAGTGEVAQLAATFDSMAERLEASFARERALEAGRRDLIAAVSHDLRTPLTTVRAMVEAMVDGVVSDPDDVRRYLRLIGAEVQHLGHLIDDLFELSQIESGALRLHVEPTGVAGLLQHTLHAYEAQAQEAGIDLRDSVAPDLPPVAADPARLERVLRNLVDNALRHTPAGGAVRVEAHRDGPAVRVTVRDTGPGIGADEVDRVFDRFYRGERARSRPERGDGRSPGAGLGLTIARGLIQAHGGRIWAERPAEGGAAFHFTVNAA